MSQVCNSQELTRWTAFTMVIEGSVSNPTMPSSPAVNKAYYRYVGQNMEIMYTLSVGDATGAAAGSGMYLFKIPDSKSIDTDLVATQSGYSRGVLGAAAIATPTDNSAGVVMCYDDTHLWIEYTRGSANEFSFCQHTTTALNSVDTRISFFASVPIVGR